MNYCCQVLGAFVSDLSAISWFFNGAWDKPLKNIPEKEIALCHGWVGYRLRAIGRISEAVQPIEKSNTFVVSNHRWDNAAAGTFNLSELHIAAGNIQKAILVAEQSVEFANLSKNPLLIAIFQSYYAFTLHQSGNMVESAYLFAKAEELYQMFHPKFWHLPAHTGFRYCDFLLDMNEQHEVLERANQTMIWAKEAKSLLDISLDKLTIGNANIRIFQLDTSFFRLQEAVYYIDQAVEGLRRAGQLDYLPLALISRAAYHRLTQNYPAALEDLEEVLDIAEPSGMRLHLTDYHLEMARLCLAMSEEQPEKLAEAKEHTELAAQLVEDTGYHRRDGEVAELKKALRIE